jgi:hypothetical protein
MAGCQLRVLLCAATAVVIVGSPVLITPDGRMLTDNGTVCNSARFQEAYDFENTQGIFAKEAACEDSIRSAGALRFGPPTAWQIFNVMCRGSCRQFTDKYKRLQLYQNITGCVCEDTQPQCPQSPTDHLCSALGYCYDSNYYDTTTCAIGACGRWAADAADYRAARIACNLNFDGASASTLHGGIVALALATLWILAR